MAKHKPGWRRVKLGQVALNTTAATKDPVGEGYERYIIGKHIPEDGSPIKTWNPVGDAEFGSRIRTMFRVGDVICTTRGPKLKVAVPQFDGLSAHTNFILRTRDPEVLLQGVLEATVRSDGFQDHLRKHFRGSTNLFVNWSDAAEYEFALPPLEEQRRMAALLTSLANAQAAMKELVETADNQRKAYLVSVFRPDRGTRDRYPNNWHIGNVDEAGEVQLGQKRDPSVHQGANMRPYLRVANVFDDEFDLSDVRMMHFADRDLPKYLLRDGDILLNEGQSADLLGRSAIWRAQVGEMYFQMTLLRFRARSGVVPEFAHAFFQHMLYTKQFAKDALQTTSIAHLSASKFGRMTFPVPPVNDQKAIVRDYNSLRGGHRAARSRADALREVRRAAFREVLAQ